MFCRPFRRHFQGPAGKAAATDGTRNPWLMAKIFNMEMTAFGRTGLKVSRMGLGCGGLSRIGQAQGASEADSIAVVQKAFDLGVNIFDTAEIYRTEDILGKALASLPRDRVVVSTKKTAFDDSGAVQPDPFRAGVEGCLKRLRTDRVEIFHFHAVLPDQYPHVRENLVPVLMKLREEGKVRFFGITEAFGTDCAHQTLSLAVQDGCWDAMMVGFNVLNQTARERVFGETAPKGIGTLVMFAVRKALGNPGNFQAALADMAAKGLMKPDPGLVDLILRESGAKSLPEVAYRLALHEPGVDVVLSGTGNMGHLEDNARSLNAPPLPEKVVARLKEAFKGIDSVSGG